jgi:thiol-disulfide isomerase/thioredoxin
LDKIPGGKEHKSYVAFRVISSEFMAQMSDPKANHASVQENYIEQLESFAEAYPKSPDAAEAMIQIGLNDELGGQEKEAQEWYRKVATNFPDTDFGKKASGAIVRLNLEGKTLNLRGKTLDGKEVQTTGPTIVHYWATWCDPCKADMAELRKLQAKYAKQNLQIVGVNLDNDAATAAKFLKENAGKYPWAHIHEQGGFQSDLATKLGVLSVPVTILIDAKGVVVKRTAGFSTNPDMIQAVGNLMEQAPAAKPKQAAKPTPNKK